MSRMKDFYVRIQNEILDLAEEGGGEITVEDALVHLSDLFPEYFTNNSEGYREVQHIMLELVDDGDLEGGYEDFFNLPQ